MSLLLDALKRAEEAKRAKQSIELKEPAPGDATPEQPIELAEEASGIAHAKALEEINKLLDRVTKAATKE